MKDCLCVSVLQQLRGLVAMNENLKKQEQQFKLHCKVPVMGGSGVVVGAGMMGVEAQNCGCG